MEFISTSEEKIMNGTSALDYVNNLKDHLGSTRVILNDNAQVVEEYDYDAFGNLMTANVTVGTPYQYTGQEYDDETELHNFRARLYDSDLMRFYAVDPEEQTASPYLYCGNNPINYVDPTGTLTGYFQFGSRGAFTGSWFLGITGSMNVGLAYDGYNWCSYFTWSAGIAAGKTFGSIGFSQAIMNYDNVNQLSGGGFDIGLATTLYSAEFLTSVSEDSPQVRNSENLYDGIETSPKLASKSTTGGIVYGEYFHTTIFESVTKEEALEEFYELIKKYHIDDVFSVDEIQQLMQKYEEEIYEFEKDDNENGTDFDIFDDF